MDVVVGGDAAVPTVVECDFAVGFRAVVELFPPPRVCIFEPRDDCGRTTTSGDTKMNE